MKNLFPGNACGLQCLMQLLNEPMEALYACIVIAIVSFSDYNNGPLGLPRPHHQSTLQLHKIHNIMYTVFSQET